MESKLYPHEKSVDLTFLFQRLQSPGKPAWANKYLMYIKTLHFYLSQKKSKSLHLCFILFCFHSHLFQHHPCYHPPSPFLTVCSSPLPFPGRHLGVASHPPLSRAAALSLFLLSFLLLSHCFVCLSVCQSA